MVLLLLLLISFHTLSLCMEDSHKVLIKIGQNDSIESDTTEINTYLKETLFDVYLAFMKTAHSEHATNIELDIGTIIESSNHWVVYNIFKIIKSQPNLSQPFTLRYDGKLLLTTMNSKQWEIFADTCNALGFFGSESKTDIWKFIEFFRFVPDSLTITISHYPQTSIAYLPDMYTPRHNRCNAKVYADKIWINGERVLFDETNNTNVFMLNLQRMESTMRTAYETVLGGRNIADYNDPELRQVYNFFVLRIRDRIYEEDFMTYGWSADANPSIGMYLMDKQNINDILRYLYLSFYRNMVERYGFDFTMSSYKFGLDQRGPILEFVFQRNMMV